ncbi:glycine cleavage system aminomethyltransferase GcvT [Brooklawnia cerclae]|uniref:Aminomethyltransferase n=1 Tax=Brooklawnia cerclae TaxID=349934 RepID=A0ABX0SLF6_9ACTN|nr:glycine cleavage system aminomethyltransferase GcvT [Brooklawnia cerclae]NIH57566.1 aminomethyltransferase [Brooklawnia cerclae]
MSEGTHGAAGEPVGLHVSPLHEWHEAHGAKLAEFGGWSMPIEYAGAGVLAEHAAVRERVGLFDVSHLGKLLVTGPGAKDHLDRLLTGDLGRIGAGRAQYTLLCNERGGVTDDLIAYVSGDERVLLVPNAANAAQVAAVVAATAPVGVEVRDLHHDRAVIAVQGPSCDDLLAAAGLPADLGYMAFRSLGEDATICRTGYTGERGIELVVPASEASVWWQRLLEAGEGLGVHACGLGARDTLRTEMGYPLHGNDITAGIDPVEAGLSWAIGWGKPAFMGRDALLAIRAAGPARRARGLRSLGRGIPRHGMEVVDASGETVIGTVTSGTFSPTLRYGIGLALVDANQAPGDVVGVRVRNRVESFELVKPPFVPSHVR